MCLLVPIDPKREQKSTNNRTSDFSSPESSNLSNVEERNDPWNGEKEPKAKLGRADGFFWRSKNINNVIYAQERINKSFQILESFPRR